MAIIVFVIVAYHYKRGRGKTETVPKPPVPTAETPASAATAATAELPATTEQVRTLLVNSTKVPQRFGNALAALEEYNIACGNAFRFDQTRPKIAYNVKSAVYYRPAYSRRAEELVAALAAAIPSQRVDITITCGQDVHALIMEALAKKVPAPEDTAVEVLNGCGIEGAAAKIEERLTANGYAVVVVGNATSFDYKKTIIEAAANETDAALKVADLFGLNDASVEPPGYDIKIVIGDDYTVAPEVP